MHRWIVMETSCSWIGWPAGAHSLLALSCMLEWPCGLCRATHHLIVSSDPGRTLAGKGAGKGAGQEQGG